MADVRTPRKSETREAESRRKPWAPPSHLEAPDPQRAMCIDGYELLCVARRTR